MATDLPDLPNDPAALQRMVAGLLEKLESQEQRLRQMQHWLEQLLRQRYGHQSERLDENQLFLFAVELADTGQPVPPEPLSASPKPKPEGHGRQRLPQSLERRRVVYDLPEQERQCPQCQCALRHIGEEISERLEYVPASLQVIEEVCHKYACPRAAPWSPRKSRWRRSTRACQGRAYWRRWR